MTQEKESQDRDDSVSVGWKAYYKAQEEIAIRGSGMGPPNHVVLRKETFKALMESLKGLLERSF